MRRLGSEEVQAPRHSTLSAYVDLVLEAGHVVWARLVSVSNQVQRPTVRPLLVPEHDNQGLVVVAAVDLDLAAALNHHGGRLLKHSDTSPNCGDSKETVTHAHAMRPSCVFVRSEADCVTLECTLQDGSLSHTYMRGS